VTQICSNRLCRLHRNSCLQYGYQHSVSQCLNTQRHNDHCLVEDLPHSVPDPISTSKLLRSSTVPRPYTCQCMDENWRAFSSVASAVWNSSMANIRLRQSVSTLHTTFENLSLVNAKPRCFCGCPILSSFLFSSLFLLTCILLFRRNFRSFFLRRNKESYTFKNGPVFIGTLCSFNKFRSFSSKWMLNFKNSQNTCHNVYLTVHLMLLLVYSMRRVVRSSRISWMEFQEQSYGESFIYRIFLNQYKLCTTYKLLSPTLDINPRFVLKLVVYC